MTQKRRLVSHSAETAKLAAPRGLTRGPYAFLGPALLLGIVTILAYLPAIQGTPLWDDDAHLTRPDLRSLGGLQRIWTEPAATQQYYPVLHSVFWLQHRIWGDSYFFYHLVNILQHVASALLLVILCTRLHLSGAWLAASLFALHPVSVESVAWMSEQKNTLSTLFYLAALLVYLRFTEHRRLRIWLAATALFALALLTKSVTTTLPAALLVIAW